MRLVVNPDVCIGAGMCALTAPDVFDQDAGDGTVILLDPAPPARAAALVRRAADVCPSGAVTVAADPEQGDPEQGDPD